MNIFSKYSINGGNELTTYIYIYKLKKNGLPVAISH